MTRSSPGQLWGGPVVHLQGAGNQTLGGKRWGVQPSTLIAQLTALLGTAHLLERSEGCAGQPKRIGERLWKMPRRSETLTRPSGSPGLPRRVLRQVLISGTGLSGEKRSFLMSAPQTTLPASQKHPAGVHPPGQPTQLLISVFHDILIKQ